MCKETELEKQKELLEAKMELLAKEQKVAEYKRRLEFKRIDYQIENHHLHPALNRQLKQFVVYTQIVLANTVTIKPPTDSSREKMI